MKRRMSSSAPSSQLNLPPLVPEPEHTALERIDSIPPQCLTSGNIAVILKVERPGSISSFASLPAFACGWGASPSPAFLVSLAALILLGTPTDFGEEDDGDVVMFGVHVATSSASPLRSVRSSGDVGERCCYCLFGPGSGITPHDGDTFRLPLSSSSSKLSAGWSVLLMFTRHGTRAPDRQRARGSRFSRRQQRTCSVGAAKPRKPSSGGVRSAVRQRGGLVWRRARMKFLVAM
jgi:hypothetical protein